jgi:hypothetical protein
MTLSWLNGRITMVEKILQNVLITGKKRRKELEFRDFHSANSNKACSRHCRLVGGALWISG